MWIAISSENSVRVYVDLQDTENTEIMVVLNKTVWCEDGLIRVDYE